MQIEINGFQIYFFSYVIEGTTIIHAGKSLMAVLKDVGHGCELTAEHIAQCVKTIRPSDSTHLENPDLKKSLGYYLANIATASVPWTGTSIIGTFPTQMHEE